VPEFVARYTGDVAWGAMFFVLFAAAFPRTRSVWTWLLALGTTELIELSQLYQAPWAVHVRATPVGALLFGRGFLVSDMVCVAAGATTAALVNAALYKGSREIPHAPRRLEQQGSACSTQPGHRIGRCAP
jgi:hypothetical protein